VRRGPLNAAERFSRLARDPYFPKFRDEPFFVILNKAKDLL
jgi:hypothetical protein